MQANPGEGGQQGEVEARQKKVNLAGGVFLKAKKLTGKKVKGEHKEKKSIKGGKKSFVDA